MNIETHRLASAWQLARSAFGLRSLAVLVTVSLPLSAQTPRVVVSTTDDLPPGAGPSFQITDGDLVAVGGGRSVDPYFLGGHFQATWGFNPGDIDAFTRLPSSRPGSNTSIVFSLLSNEGGFLDGDLLALVRGGGAAVLVSELDLASAIGAPGANIDVDAVSYDDSGRILFSLTTDLPGTALGTIADGDILRLEPSFAGVTLVLSESDVQARFTQATGRIDAILDVQGLEWANGEVWVAVQSPSTHDGAVIRIAGTPQVVLDETAMGLGGAEIDALGEMRSGDEIPTFGMSLDQALPGDLVHIEVHGRPNAPMLVLMAGKAGYINFSRFPGFGGWYVDRLDPWLRALASAQALPLVFLDGTGRYTVDWNLPVGTEFGVGLSGELGWSFQLVDLSNLELSAPFRVRKL